MDADWLRVAHRRRGLLLGIMLLLASALGWLGWRLLAQDEQLARQRLLEQRDIAADLLVAGFDQRLSAVERDLAAVLAGADPGIATPAEPAAVLVSIGADGVRAWPDRRLLYYPDPAAAGATGEPAALVRADDLEFGDRDSKGAIAVLRPLAQAGDPQLAAGALVRLARNYEKTGKLTAAVESYGQLATLGPVVVGGMPAPLAARLGRMTLFERQHDAPAALNEARALARELREPELPVSEATYEFLAGEVSRRLGAESPDAAPRSAHALAEATAWLRARWSERELPAAGRLARAFPSGPVSLVWRASADRVLAFIAAEEYLQQVWLGEALPTAQARAVRIAITTPDGAAVVGAIDASEHPAVRLAPATKLPWTLQVASTGAGLSAFSERRTLLVAGMGVLLGLIAAGAWFVERTVAREFALAELQSEFVSAVSHELRTPLTTLCQLSELLMRGRVASDDDRRQYYELLHGESQRLRRLVETLLDFGRLEAGRVQLRFAPIDLGALVRDTLDEFARSGQAAGHVFSLDAEPREVPLSADREMFRAVLWNLFENAVKYSPGSPPVLVELRASADRIAIAVRDHGIGIPRGEHARIFEKFVRGSAARGGDIRGTGVGLAMARRIVQAHGGEITVESRPGAGSTFTIALPVSAGRARDVSPCLAS